MRATNGKAVAYLRVSDRSQTDGDGFPRQREAITRWARQARVEVVAWYEEPGISGTLADRPALARLLVDLEANHAEVSLVVVERVDRLARDLYVQESVIRDVARVGRELVSAVEGDLSSDPTRRLVRQVMGAIAEYDRTMLVARLKAARDRKREREGRCEGQRPFGDLPGEAATIERIRALRRKPKAGAKRLGWRRIAAVLQAEGHPTRAGRTWDPTTVRRIATRSLPTLARADR